MKIRNRNRRQFVAGVEQVESRCLLSVAPYYTVQDLGSTTSLPFIDNPINTPIPDLLPPSPTGDSWAYMRASNHSGQSTGVAASPTGGQATAFFYSNGVMSDLTPGFLNGWGVAINKSGQVIGDAVKGADPPGGFEQAFVTGPNGTGITFLTDGTTRSGSSDAYGINSEGDVVGSSGGNVYPYQNGFIYKDGTMYNLNNLIENNTGINITVAFTIDDSGRIVARGIYNNAYEFFLLTPIPPVPVAPTITWSNPADIVYGTPLSSTQLDATASVPGTFTYTPAAGTVLHAGAAQTLSVTFTPDDTTDYTTVTTTTSINVLQAPLTVKANNAYSQIGFPIPPLTGTITGLVNGDTDIATYTTTATQSSYLGNYPIVPHLADPNYNITIVNGTLTIGYYPFPWPPF